MSNTNLRVIVERDNIIITQPGTRFLAVYFKPRGQPFLVAKDAPVGTEEFRIRAWQVANEKARELGWLL